MKKTILSILSLSLLIFALQSCNSSPKLMTEAEVEQRIAQLTALDIDSLTTVLEADCERRLPAMIAAKRDSIVASLEEKK